MYIGFRGSFDPAQLLGGGAGNNDLFSPLSGSRLWSVLSLRQNPVRNRARSRSLEEIVLKDIVSDFSIEQLRLDRAVDVKRQAPPRAAAWRLPHPGLILLLCLGAELYARAGSMIRAGRFGLSLGLIIAGAGVLWGVRESGHPSGPARDSRFTLV